MKEMCRVITVIALAAIVWANPCSRTIAQTPTTSQQFNLALQCFFGLSDYTHTTLINYNEPSTSTAATASIATVVLVQSATKQAVDLSVIFPNLQKPEFYSIQDATNPGVGFSVQTNASGSALSVNPNGFIAWRANPSGGPDLVYITNPSSTSQLAITITCLSN